MPNSQKSPVQSLSDLENRLKRRRADVAVQRAKLRDRCARLLFEKCPYEVRRLVVEHVTGEEWDRLKRLGINDHLPPKRGPMISGTTTDQPQALPSDPAQLSLFQPDGSACG